MDRWRSWKCERVRYRQGLCTGCVIDLRKGAWRGYSALGVVCRNKIETSSRASWFIYLAQYSVHSIETLQLFEDSLSRFHDIKDIFVDLAIRNAFNTSSRQALSMGKPNVRMFAVRMTELKILRPGPAESGDHRVCWALFCPSIWSTTNSTTMTSPPVIPAEIFDTIINDVAKEGEQKSLSTLSLTLSSLLCHVRAPRFHQIRLDRRKPCLTKDSAKFSSFAEIITVSPAIGRCVREIYIDFPNMCMRLEEYERSECKPVDIGQSNCCDGQTRLEKFVHRLNALSLILCSTPRLVVFSFIVMPYPFHWNKFPPTLEATISSLCGQESVKKITLIGLSDISSSFCSSIIQNRHLTSLILSHISRDQADHVFL